MSSTRRAPSEAHVEKLVKIQPDKGLTSKSELNLTSGRVTYRREAKGRGYWATTQVNVLSPEIIIVSDADTVHKGGRQNSQIRYGKELRDRRGLRQLHGIKRTMWELGRPDVFLRKVCYDKSEKGKELQMIHRESDKFIVAKKQSNICGAKGLTVKSLGKRTHLPDTELDKRCQQNFTDNSLMRKVLLKSRVREICTHGSVRGFVVSSRRWL